MKKILVAIKVGALVLSILVFIFLFYENYLMYFGEKQITSISEIAEPRISKVIYYQSATDQISNITASTTSAGSGFYIIPSVKIKKEDE